MRFYRDLLVTISVFAATVTAAPLAVAQERLGLKLDFSAADTNNDGKLGPKEVTRTVTDSIIDNLKGRLGDGAATVAKENAPLVVRQLFSAHDANHDGFLTEVEVASRGVKQDKEEQAEEKFEIELTQRKKAGVIYNDRQSDVVIIVVPGANQDKSLAENYNSSFSSFFNGLGYSTASIYTNFGPMIDTRGSQNNRYLRKVMDKLQEKYGNRNFILLGGSNGGMAVLQAVEHDRDNILAVIANPSIYLPKQRLKGLPVYLRIGEKDGLGWAKHFDRMKQGLLRLGVLLDAKLLPNERHIPALSYNEMTKWLKGHKIEPGVVKLVQAKVEAPHVFRTFVDKTGKHKVEAKLVKYKNSSAHLEKRNGEIVIVPELKLSDEDLKWIRKELNRRKAAGK